MSDDLAAVAQSPANETVAPAVNDSSTNASPTPVTIVEKHEPTMDETLLAAYNKSTKPDRDEKGKFTAKTEGAEPATGEAEQPAEEAAAETESTDQPEESKVEPAKPVIDPPHSWSGEHKAKWATVPPELQTYIANRESEAHAAIASAGRYIKSHEPFDQLIQHHQEKFAKRGISPAQSFATLLAAQDALDENPLSGILQIGLSYGIDLRPYLQGAQQQPGQASQPDPMVSQLRAELSEIKGKMTASERAAQEAAQSAQDQQIAQANVAITDFAKDKPHFEEVRVLMGRLIESGEAPDLNTAYDMAVNAKPDIRQRIQADQRKADEAKRLADQKAKADAARKAAATNVRSGPSTQSPKTMDDDLQEIARRHYG